MSYTDDENYFEHENVEFGEWKGHVIVWRAAILRSGALGNTKKSPMMGGSTQQGVENKMSLKYGGDVDESDEYKKNKRSADHGMTKRKDHVDGKRNT